MEFDKIKSIISEVLSIDADGITEETTFVDDLGADSLDSRLLWQSRKSLRSRFRQKKQKKSQLLAMR